VNRIAKYASAAGLQPTDFRSGETRLGAHVFLEDEARRSGRAAKICRSPSARDTIWPLPPDRLHPFGPFNGGKYYTAESPRDPGSPGKCCGISAPGPEKYSHLPGDHRVRPGGALGSSPFPRGNGREGQGGRVQRGGKTGTSQVVQRKEGSPNPPCRNCRTMPGLPALPRLSTRRLSWRSGGARRRGRAAAAPVAKQVLERYHQRGKKPPLRAGSPLSLPARAEKDDRCWTAV
jgi:hypothetical protein